MSVYKDSERGTWYCQFRYKDWQGRNHSTTKRGFKTKREAKAYEAECIKQMQAMPDMTLESLYELYIAHQRKNVSLNTCQNAEKHFRRYILPYLASMPVRDINANVLREWRNAYRQDFTIADTTAHVVDVSFSSLLRFGVKYYSLPANPFELAGLTPKNTPAMQIWELDEFEKFLSVIPLENVYDKIVFSLLYVSGMRIGELMGLSVSDFDFENNTIDINKSYDTHNYIVSKPKTINSYRVISIPDKVMVMVRDFIKQFYEPPARIFSLCTHQTLRVHMRKYCHDAGVRVIRLHDFRHSHASLLIHQNVPITAIAKRLGHKNAYITLQVYAHVYQQSDADISKMLNSVVKLSS